MQGPRELGHWSALRGPNCGKDHEFLQAGKRYRVVRSFMDFDGHGHPECEEWLFLGYSFLPYEDGLSLFVSFDGVCECLIPMQWRPGEQGAILDQLSEYLVEAPGSQAGPTTRTR